MNIKSQKGITLTEVIVTLAIMAIIAAPITMVFTTAYTSFINESDKNTAQQYAREVMFGDGLNSKGIIGELEGSNASTIGINVSPQSISIRQNDTGAAIKYEYQPIESDYGTLIYTNASGAAIDLFNNAKSGNGFDVKLNEFFVEKVVKTADTDTDLINITLKLSCGNSGIITLKNSYRIPAYER